MFCADTATYHWRYTCFAHKNCSVWTDEHLRRHSDLEILALSSEMKWNLSTTALINSIITSECNQNKSIIAMVQARAHKRPAPAHLSAKWSWGIASSVHKCVFSTKYLLVVQRGEEYFMSAACQSMFVVCSGASLLHISPLYHNGSPHST